jgi:hypothetical protein
MALSWRDMSTPAAQPKAAPPAPSAAPSAAPSGGASWRDMSTPLATTPSTAPAPPTTAPAAAAALSDIAQPGDTLGNMAWTDPRAANASTKDFMLAHLAELGKGLSQMGGTAADYARVAANTYGRGDSTLASLQALYADVTGNARNPGQNNPNDYLSNLTAAKAATAAASDRLGTAGNIAANMTGGGPLGEVASSVGGMAAPYVGKWAGGVLGSAAAGGGSTAAGELGRNETVSPWDIGVGTVLGAAGGAPGGVVGRGGTPAPAISADDLHAAASQIYKPLDNIIFDAKSEVHPELDAFKNAIGSTTDLTGKRLDQATGTSAILDDLYGSPQLTGRNIQEAQRSLDKIASSPSSSVQDQEYAPKLKSALQNVMDNGLPFAGVPAGNQATGYAGLVQRAGDLIHGRAEDVDTLNTMVAKSQAGNKPDLGAQMGAYMTSNQGMNFIKPGTPQYDAANALSATAQAPLTDPAAGITMWDLKKHLLWPAVGLGGAQIAGAYGTGEGHQPWWASIPEDIAGVGAGFLLKNRLAAAGAKAQQQALDAARTAFSTGQAQAPVLPGAPLRDTMRRLIFGQTAAGQLPGQ